MDRIDVWREGSPLVKSILGEGMQEHAGRIPDLGKYFRLSDLVLRCMDGRTPGGVHLAGSGILLGLKGAAEFAKSVEKQRGSKLEAVTYHRDCGAAADFVKGRGQGEDPLVAAKTFAEQFGEMIDCEVFEAENTHSFHPERAIYYDGTGTFDWSRGKRFPRGFVISRAYLGFDVTYAKLELATALKIALTPHNEGGHGFGEMFTSDQPLLVAAIGCNRTDLAKIMAEAADTIGMLDQADRSRVVLDGFIRPKDR